MTWSWNPSPNPPALWRGTYMSLEEGKHITWDPTPALAGCISCIKRHPFCSEVVSIKTSSPGVCCLIDALSKKCWCQSFLAHLTQTRPATNIQRSIERRFKVLTSQKRRLFWNLGFCFSLPKMPSFLKSFWMFWRPGQFPIRYTKPQCWTDSWKWWCFNLPSELVM